jgi:L-rhamnose isomerase/sugar isomerase
MENIIGDDIVQASNAAREKSLASDYEHLGEQLDRRGIDIKAILQKVETFGVAIPSWGVGTGGTRFARFPGDGEPRDIFDKIEDCAVIQQLTRATPTVSLHIPWDKADPERLKQAASRFGLGFDAMNSNTFSDAKGQKLSYKFGSLSHADAGTRRQAVEHNLECIEIGKTIGSKALTVWIGDGSNFPGAGEFRARFRALP